MSPRRRQQHDGPVLCVGGPADGLRLEWDGESDIVTHVVSTTLDKVSRPEIHEAMGVDPYTTPTLVSHRYTVQPDGTAVWIDDEAENAKAREQADAETAQRNAAAEAAR